MNSSSNGNTPKKVPSILVNQNEKDPSKGSYLQIPRFWIDEYFSSNVTWQFPDGSKRKGTRVPTSFWKYTLHLWRWVSIPQSNFSTDIAMDQFPVRPEAAVMWTAAYAVSGVMKVEIGTYSSRHDNPTVFAYDPETTHAAWRCFLSALDYAYACRESGRQAKRREKDLPVSSTAAAWKVLVAREVDNHRERAGLARINEKFLDNAAKGHITDGFGRRIAERDKDGIVQPLYFVKQRLQRPGESDDDYERRLLYEMDEQKSRGF